MNCCSIWDVFDEKKNRIKEYAHWKLLVRNRNTTLGNCVAITKRHMERFSEIKPEEMLEFTDVVKDAEKALRESFQYDKINYLMLMMKDRHAHFHLIPRYSTKRVFAGLEWADTGWPKAASEAEQPISQDILDQVKAEILKHI